MPEGARRSVSARALALFSAGLAVVLAAVAFVAYRELLHYERRAVLHVPAGAAFGVRVDLEQLVLFEPVRKHLLPLVDQVSFGAGAHMDPEGAPSGRLARLREEAGLNLGLDLRELVFASLGRGDGWVLAAGGIFPGGDLLERVARVLASEPGARVRRQGALLILGPGELALARAADGVLLLGSNASAVEWALLPSDAHRALGLMQEGAAALAALPAWLDRGVGGGLGFERVTGRLDFGDPLTLTLELAHTAAASNPPRRGLERWLRVDTSTFTPAADWGGERALLARARFAAVSPTLTVVTTTWQHGELDRACRSLATWLEAATKRLGPGAQ